MGSEPIDVTSGALTFADFGYNSVAAPVYAELRATGSDGLAVLVTKHLAGSFCGSVEF